MTVPTANQILGITDLFATWNLTGGTQQIITLPKPTEMTYDPKVKNIIQTERTRLGVVAPIGRIQDEQLPELDLTWNVTTLNLLAMRYGFAFGVPGTTPIINFGVRLNVTAATYAAATTGFEGYGVTADAVSVGSYEDPVAPGVNTVMTQQPYATFNASTTNSFAVGANGALKFSTDMINANIQAARVATIVIPNSVSTGLQLLGTDFSNFNLVVNQILADRSLIQTTYQGLQLLPAQVDSKVESKIKYQVINNTGGCFVPLVNYLGQVQKRAC